MKIVYLDTSTERFYLSVANDSHKASLILDCGYSHTENIQDSFLFLLKKAGIERAEELDTVILGAGPGSFTGIRIAYSFIKGLIVNYSIKVIELSTLEAMAISLREDNGNIFFADRVYFFPLIFGRKQKYYGGCWDDKGKQVIPYFDKTQAEILSVLEKQFTGNQASVVFPGDKNGSEEGMVIIQDIDEKFNREAANLLSSCKMNAVSRIFEIRPEKVLSYIDKHFSFFDQKTIDEIQPLYLRESDAKANK